MHRGPNTLAPKSCLQCPTSDAQPDTSAVWVALRQQGGGQRMVSGSRTEPCFHFSFRWAQSRVTGSTPTPATDAILRELWAGVGFTPIKRAPPSDRGPPFHNPARYHSSCSSFCYRNDGSASSSTRVGDPITTRSPVVVITSGKDGAFLPNIPIPRLSSKL